MEEKWVSSVAMVTAAAPCQPPRLLATNLTMRSFVQPVGMGARRVRLGARVCMKFVCVCVCVQAHTSACSELVCMPGQGNPQIQEGHFLLPCPLKG